MIEHLTDSVLWMLGAILAALLIASGVLLVLRGASPGKDYTELGQRIRSWWVMVGVFALAMLLSRTSAIVLFGIVSFLALKEYLSLIPTRRADRRVLFWAYLAIPVQYLWVGTGWYGMFIIFIPVYVFLLLPMRMVLIGETRDFLRAVGTLHWGLMTTVFSISHVAFLLALPEDVNPSGGGAGLVLFLVFLTQFNDIAQFLWGRTFGSRKVVPQISPGKTWGGLLGGMGTTIVLSVLLAPRLTPLDTGEALMAGVIIGLGGFVGDITVSALKRDLRIKDSGGLIPGHGGILDRVDSLTYTAPLFFHFIYHLHY